MCGYPASYPTSNPTYYLVKGRNENSDVQVLATDPDNNTVITTNSGLVLALD